MFLVDLVAELVCNISNKLSQLEEGIQENIPVVGVFFHPDVHHQAEELAGTDPQKAFRQEILTPEMAYDRDTGLTPGTELALDVSQYNPGTLQFKLFVGHSQ
jgi:hypothetical protein